MPPAYSHAVGDCRSLPITGVTPTGIPRLAGMEVPPFAKNQSNTWRMPTFVGVSGPVVSRLISGPRYANWYASEFPPADAPFATVLASAATYLATLPVTDHF